MARIFITGSSTGLGLLAGQCLARQGHSVVLHARSEARASDAWRTLPEAEAIVVGDLETISEMRDVAAQINDLGLFDAVIHNAGILERNGQRMTADGLPAVFAVNTLAAYLLTVLIQRPKRLIYLSSSMHRNAIANLDELVWRNEQWNGSVSYSQTKLYDTMLAFAFARLWPDVLSNAVDPGWVPTRMGGSGASDDLDLGYETQVCLAIGSEPVAQVTGQLFFHMQPVIADPEAYNMALQDQLLEFCGDIASAAMP